MAEAPDGGAGRRRRDVGDDAAYSYDDDAEEYVPYVPVKQRRLQAMQRLGARGAARGVRAEAGEDAEQAAHAARSKAQSLLQEALERRAHEDAHGEKSAEERAAEEERAILEAHAARKKLAGHAEVARDIHYTEAIARSWRAPHFVRQRAPGTDAALRRRHHVLVDGDEVPPLITNFRDMKVPACVIDYLEHDKGIRAPTPIQMQGLPAAFAGRDMIGIAFTGSGKTLTFSLPLALFASESERRLPHDAGDGPVGLVVCPSRELARQTCDGLVALGAALERGGYAPIRVLLCTGGISMADQAPVLRRGFHVAVATPGRLLDMLEKRRVTLEACTYLCLDEADRMIDMGFEEDVRNIMSYFPRQRQTLLFSATMPRKIQAFAEQSLIRPIVINVGRAGAASLDVIQEAELVRPEAKMVYLLECLQKTAPPVIIFSDNKGEVDAIHEFLLRKGVAAVAIHGSKSQEEREYAIRSFRSGHKDVMVASGVASKGLDFPDIQHVINFTMPREIEDYVHQIGRTGRSGRTGIATTFVNENTPEPTLLDLKYLLREAKQRIPPFLATLRDPRDGAGELPGCAICGGLGHSVRDCPKLEDSQRRRAAGAMTRDAMRGGD